MAQTFVDSWRWIAEFYVAAINSNDEERLSLWELYRNAENNSRHNWELSIQTFEHVIQLAVKLKEPHWEIACEYLQAFVNRNVNLKRINELLIKSSKPPYNTCPMVSEIYVFAIEEYIKADAIGYKERIEEAVEFTLASLPVSRENYGRVLYAKAQLDYEFGKYAEALENVSEAIAVFQDKHKRAAFAYLLKTRIHYCLRQNRESLACAVEMGNQGKQAKEPTLIHIALVWQKLLLVRQGKQLEANPIRRRIDEIEKRSPDTDESLVPEAELYDYYSGFWWKFFSILVRMKILRTVLQTEGQTFIHLKAYLKLIKVMVCSPGIVRFAATKFAKSDNLETLIEKAKTVATSVSDSNRFEMQLNTILKDTRISRCSPSKRGDYLQP